MRTEFLDAVFAVNCLVMACAWMSWVGVVFVSEGLRIDYGGCLCDCIVAALALYP